MPFELGDQITVRAGNGREVTGRVVEILMPEVGSPGYRRLGKPTVFSSYSGGYCSEHKHPVEPGPRVAPTRPHYTIITDDRRGLERCECQVVTDSIPVSLW